MERQSLSERVAFGVVGVILSAVLILGIGGIKVGLPWTTGGAGGGAALREPAIKLPYDTAIKNASRLLPCCNVSVALAILNPSASAQQEALKAGYLSTLPMLRKGAVVSVRAFYAEHGDSVGQQILLFPTPERLTDGTAALVGTADGATGYVPALLVFPP